VTYGEMNIQNYQPAPDNVALPMSTTWVFIGLLAVRELGIRLNIDRKIKKNIGRIVLADL